MSGSSAHRWYVIALAAVALLLATAAGVAQLVKWEGPWALTLGIAALAVGLMAGIVEKVIVPKKDKVKQLRVDDERARALELMLTSRGDRTELAVLNKDRYEVTDVRIECWPLGGLPSANPQPPLEFDGLDHPKVSYERIAGGGQIIRVADLRPLPNPNTASGISLGSWVLAHGAPSRMEFQVDWLDHERRGRRLVGVGDMKDFAAIAWVQLEPPEPLVNSPTWWGRLKHTLRRPARDKINRRHGGILSGDTSATSTSPTTRTGHRHRHDN